MQAAPEELTHSEVSLQLLLFVDRRPSAQKQIQQIHSCLESLKTDYAFELQIVDVGQQPYLAEHFKLVATPTLIKISPEPKHTLAGSDLVAQLESWLPRWASSLEESQGHLELPRRVSDPRSNSVAYVEELIQLSDEAFRLQQEKEELLAQLQFKDRVIAILAHDLRNPLTAANLALGTLELSYDETKSEGFQFKPGFVEQLFQHARTQIRVMDRMISDILQASKGNNADLQIKPHPLNLPSLCYEILEQMKKQIEGKSQQLKTDIPQDLPLVYADKERVRQVVVNLLDNAIKYTPVGGRIELTVLDRTTEKIQVIVCDDGPGIPKEERDRIFEDRFRLERDTAQDGYGLGLALCQRIVRSHYGRIWVDSASGHGSCFNFTLPVYRK